MRPQFTLSSFTHMSIIYALTEPYEPQRIRYIGQTAFYPKRSPNPTLDARRAVEKRLYSHLIEAKNAPPPRSRRQSWLYELVQRGEQPGYRIVEIVPIARALAVERATIRQYRAAGYNLVNDPRMC